MNKAHVFQHKYTGLQIFVYGKHSEESARSELYIGVVEPKSWIYLGEKTAQDA